MHYASTHARRRTFVHEMWNFWKCERNCARSHGTSAAAPFGSSRTATGASSKYETILPHEVCHVIQLYSLVICLCIGSTLQSHIGSFYI